MNKVVLISDIHIGVRNDNKYYVESQLKFFESQFIPYFEQNGITELFILGDLFDRRKYVNFNTLHIYKRRLFDVLETKGININILVGNHDTTYKNTNKVNSPELLLSEYKNITVYTSPQDVFIHNKPIAVVPWINSENYNKFIEFNKNTKAKVMFGHFEINDFYMYANSIKCSHGIDQNFFKKYKMVLSGHFHEKSTNNNISYLGAPSEYNWNDAECDRGFHVLDLDKNDLTFIKNHDTLHHRIYYDDSVDLTEFNFNQFKGTILKLIVNEKDDVHHYDLYVSSMLSSDPESFEIVDNTEFRYVDEDDIDEDALMSEDLTSIVSSYIDVLETDLDKTKIKKMFDGFYNMAENKE